MDTKKLERWANMLLDTGKRNNLINFRDTKISTVEVVLPHSEVLFGKVDSTVAFEVYDPKIADDEDNLYSADAVRENDIKEDLQRKHDRTDYINMYSSRIHRANQILLYNAWSNPMTALKNINKKARTAIEETGVNVAYMAFGFVHWKESETSNGTYRAPLLLVPITVENESSISPYFIKMAEDDVIVNPTLSFKLNGEYGLTLPPYQDNGLADYCDKVKKIVAKLGWFVTLECKIGIFSFLKINMYQDLTQNASTILQNNNVRMLLGEAYEKQAISIESGEHHVKNPLIELHNVVDADSSQIEAIEMAKAGVSFVLQGPPGTGKSQTITNIIAECLNDGKKVLFVSEKLAALQVVFDKLKKAGLDEFCLELHSYKANKKDVIADLCHTLRAGKSSVSARADLEIEQKATAQQELDGYEKELHITRDVINKSLYQLYNAYAACRGVADIGIAIPDIQKKGEVFLSQASSLLGQYVEFVPFTGYDYKTNCWYGYCNPDTSYQTLQTVKENMQILAEALEDLIPLSEKVSSDYGVVCDSLEDVVLWKDCFTTLSSTNFLTPSFLQKSAFAYTMEKLTTLQQQSEEIIAERSRIDAVYDNDVYKINTAEWQKKLERQFTGFFSRLFNPEYKEIIGTLRLASKSGKKPSYEEAVVICRMVANYHKKMDIFINGESIIKDGIGTAYNGVDTNWGELLNEAHSLERLYNKGVTFGRISDFESTVFELEKENFAAAASRIDDILGACTRAIDQLSEYYDASIIELKKIPMKSLMKKLDTCMNEFDSVNNWCRLWVLIGEIKKSGIGTYLDKAIKQSIPTSDLVMSYQKSFYYQWIDHILHQSTSLSGFSRIGHDRTVELFSQKDETQFAISKVQIRAELSANRPSLDMISSGSAVSVLLREGEKKQKQKSIRNLLAETGGLVQIIKPCFLMSPLSVSTFLDSDAIRFDVVVFDEASQIFPQDAIGAIYRGKQLIVVGDSKQMPPSNFFNTTVDVDSDEDIGDVTDFESILDICSTTFPQLRLKWHYRSRFEQLITFSNKNFYDNDLITFPSSRTDGMGVGVDYLYAGGVFDHKSRNNRKEAEFIADLVYKNIEMYPERSLGVVAFSIAQQDLIEYLLAKKRQEDPSKEFFFKSDAAEPFFIKNLETVQGDERDTIIFSVAYAKDSQGRLMHNFGPLNRAGGERRLNVAVTRAKMNVQLVASIHHTDIDLSRTQAEGAKLLKDYLDYAENGQVALERTISVDPFEQYDSEFELEVCDFLRQNGYTVDTQVGCSHFRIDLALKRPDSSDYVLAIECDGATYHSSRNARDRDRLRQEILERMGWTFYRIWSTDWFKNGTVERKCLLEACAKALNGPVLPVRTVNIKSAIEEPIFEEEVLEQHFEFPAYEMANIRSICARNYNFINIVKEILEVEAPLSEEWLLKRICFYFNRSKVTSVVQDEFNKKMYGCSRYGIIRQNGFLYLQGQNDYTLRVPVGNEKRDVKYIAKEELAAGIYEVLKHNITADKDGLFRSITKQLGIQRMGDSINTQMEEALGMLKNLVEIDGEMLSLRK